MFLSGWESTLNAFKIEIYPFKKAEGIISKILTH